MDPSQASQTETFTCMSCDSYNAAAKGNIDFFKDITDHESLGLLQTPNKNTILHIYITALKSGSDSTTPNAGLESTILDEGTESTATNFVKKILTICPSFLWQASAKSETPLHIAARSKSTTTLNAGSESAANFVEEILEMCPSLSRQANAKGETPLHIAARYGHDDIVEVLIKYCATTLHDQDLEEGIEPVKEMLRMMNKQKDTALHEAVRYNHLEVVKLLISKDPNFSYSANDADETPLYIAAERGFKDVLIEILAKCKSPMHGGPLGRTALHAAVISNNAGMVMIERILEKIDGISREVDDNGWTPLHLAAYFNHRNIAKQLLDKDREVAYMKDTKGRTPLHIAAHEGCVDAMKVIIERCPDCCELVDNRGWNVLHFALKGRLFWLIEDIKEIIIEKGSLNYLLNEKNAEGDAPLHFFDTLESLLLLKKFVSHPQVDEMAFNKQNLNARDIATIMKKRSSYKKKYAIMYEFHGLPRRVITLEEDTTKQEGEDGDKGSGDKENEEWMSLLRNASEAHLVVATLITTVTFAACITMPGGFASSGESSHPAGSTLLRKNAAFKAFVITDTISMVLSSSAVFIHLLMPFLFHKDYDEEHRENVVMLALILILGAMITMVLAFVTGTYAVLMPSLDLAIANCILGLTFFAIIFLVVKKLIIKGGDF